MSITTTTMGSTITTTERPPEAVDWAGRWQGGLCPVGALGGLPIRHDAYAGHRPLDEMLTLPPFAVALDAAPERVRARWEAALGGPVALVGSVERARALLLAAGRVEPGEAVAVPANATRALVEAVKAHGARPLFLPLDDALAPSLDAAMRRARIVWAQPLGGLGTPPTRVGQALWLDCADTLPIPVACGRHSSGQDASSTSLLPLGEGQDEGVLAGRGAVGRPHPSPLPEGEGTPTVQLGEEAAATIYGLHLAPDPAQGGALVAFGDAALADRVAALLEASDAPDWLRAAAQLARLQQLAERQQNALEATWRGLDEAAGLPLAPLPSDALAAGVAVEVPDECEPATFHTYVRGENTPIRWLPDLRPIHYAAARELGPGWRESAARLARWLLVPVGPDHTPEEIAHAVLGVVKAADYLGVRWRTDPARAAAYARQMVGAYGPDHDAYRPAFPVPAS